MLFSITDVTVRATSEAILGIGQDKGTFSAFKH